MKFVRRSKEKENVSDLYTVIQDGVLRNRIKTCLEWYMEKAAKYKKCFHFFSVVSIIMPLLITVVNNLAISEEASACTRTIITVCSVVASLASSLLCLFKFQEKWILYRNTAENMKKELSLYKAETLENKDEEQLIIKLEECMCKERAEWFLLSNENLNDKNSREDHTEDKKEGK